MPTQTVTITDFVRKLGDYMDLLPKLEGIIITRDGRPFARIQATSEEKNRQLLEVLKTIDPKLWEDDKVWKKIQERRNRKHRPIKL